MNKSNKKRQGLLIAIAVASGVTSSALAQINPTLARSDEDLELVYGDRAIISAATGTPQTLRRAPAVATVITAEDIARLGFSDLNEALESVPGIHVNRVAPLYASNYAIRGIGGNGVINPQVLVLKNGIPLTDLYNGDKGNSWVSMPLTHVARIEIIRGPGSALYGADAFAGVINIITKSAREIAGTQLGARLASFNSTDVWLQHGGKLGDFSVAAYLQAGRTDGQNSLIDQDAQTLNDSRFATKVSKAPGPLNTAYRAFDAQLDIGYGNWLWRSAYKVRNDVGLGAGVNSALDPEHKLDVNSISSDLSWTSAQIAENWQLGASLSFMRMIEETPLGLALFPAGARIGPSYFPDGMIGGPSRSQRSIRLSSYATYTGWRGHMLRFGAGHDDLNLYHAATFKNFLLSPTGLPIPTGAVQDYNAIQPHILPHRRRVNYVYLQDEWQIRPDWFLTAGLRHDRYDDFGGTSNPRLALVWDASVNLTAKLLTGRAFRAPSFNEQYGVNPVNRGNPDLSPEKISTHEFVLNWQASPGLSLNLNLFDYAMSSIIRSVANPAPAPGTSYRNVGAVDGHGAELEINWQLSQKLNVTLQHAWQTARDAQTGADPSLAPRHHSYASLSWQADAASTLSAQINRVAGRQRDAGDNRKAIADYTTLDLSWRYRQGDWDISLSGRNVLNADAREPSLAPGLALPHDFPVAPRTWVLQLNRKL